MKKFLLASTALVAFAAGAQAADLGVARAPVAAAVVAPVYNWTGVFIGGQVGYEWARFARVNTVPFANTYNGSGLVGGLHAGYNWQGASPLVVGVIADIEAAGVNGNDANVGGSLDRGRIQWQGSLRGRLGFAADRALIYATGGLAFGGLSFSNDNGVVNTFNRTRIGWTLGAGVEYAINPNWSVGVEYRYTDFGRASSPGFPAALPNGAAGYQTTTTSHAVRATLSYHFVTGGPVVARY